MNKKVNPVRKGGALDPTALSGKGLGLYSSKPPQGAGLSNGVNKRVLWDYDVRKMDLSNPKVKIWYLNRKLRFGDLAGLNRTDLKKYLPKLNISPSLKELLRNYLKSHA